MICLTFKNQYYPYKRQTRPTRATFLGLWGENGPSQPLSKALEAGSHLKSNCSSFFTSLAEDPDLGAGDGSVVLVREDSHSDASAVERQHGPAQVHVGESKHAQVQSGGSRQDVSEETGERRLRAVRQRAQAGTGEGEKNNTEQEMSLLLYTV